MKILILGASGMLGHKIFHFIKKNNNYEVIGTIRNSIHSNVSFLKYYSKDIINKVDANNFITIKDAILYSKPKIIINCIGIIKQLEISKDYVQSISINSLFPHKLAHLCSTKKIRLIHFSTDCVFSGKNGNYLESDIPDATDLYGRTKLLGEIDYNNFLTLRTSIIGHELNSRNGLLEWFLSEKNSINGYLNSIFSGFTTVEIANILERQIIPNYNLNGLYHISSNPISKYELLKLIAKIYKKDIEILPFNNNKEDRSLNSSKFRNLTGYNPPEWSELIVKMHKDYIESCFYIKEE